MARRALFIVVLSGIFLQIQALPPTLPLGQLTLSTLTDTTSAESTEPEDESDSAINEEFLQKQYRDIRIHKTFAFTTGGLLLASAGTGIYHFFDMRQQGHRFRDSIGFTEEHGNIIDQNNEILSVWRTSQSQGFRVLHGALITAASISYSITATIELSMPRMSKNPVRYSDTHIHKYLFLTHASLMAANIGLGFLESYSLSRGKHELMMGAGVAHMVVGIAAPVMVFTSGLAFKLPWY